MKIIGNNIPNLINKRIQSSENPTNEKEQIFRKLRKELGKNRSTSILIGNRPPTLDDLLKIMEILETDFSLREILVFED